MKFFILFVLLILTACNTKRDSFGPYDRVIVFGDKELWDEMKTVVKDSIGRPRFVPRLEEEYLIDYKPLEEFDIFNSQRNIVFLISMDKNNSLLKFADQLLSDRARQAIRNHEFNFFYQQDIYANRQGLLLYIIDKTENAVEVFKQQIATNQEYQKFVNYSKMRLKEDRLTTRNDQNLNVMKEKLGYSLDAPDLYRLEDLVPSGEKNVVSFYSQKQPLKWLSVHRIDSISKNEIDMELIFNRRDSIMSWHFENQKVLRGENLSSNSIEVDGLKGSRIQGSYLYLEDGLIGGGPFINYSLYDDANNRLYLIDGFLFELEKRKSETLMVIEEIMKTFKRER